MYQISAESRRYPLRSRGCLLFFLCILLVLPVFIQIESGIFRNPVYLFDSGGLISRLPLPVSILAVFAGIVTLGNYSVAKRTISVFFVTVFSFTFTTFMSASLQDATDIAKLLLLGQFLLPIPALIFGEMYGAKSLKPEFELAALLVILAIVPAQLIYTWMQGYALLSPSLYFFSIYQHLQYFPMVVTSLGLMAATVFWRSTGWLCVAKWFLLPLIFAHALASQSIISIVTLTMVLAYLVFKNGNSGGEAIKTFILICATLLIGIGYMLLPHEVQKTQSLGSKFQAEVAKTATMSILPGFSQRITTWKFYSSGVIESPGKFMLGHSEPPDRTQHPSAHNYWLDGVYNFGILAILPLIILVIRTFSEVWWRRHCILDSPVLLGPALAIGYLIFIENMFKVGMRQPYPGMVTFFIWGILLSRLKSTAYKV